MAINCGHQTRVPACRIPGAGASRTRAWCRQSRAARRTSVSRTPSATSGRRPARRPASQSAIPANNTRQSEVMRAIEQQSEVIRAIEQQYEVIRAISSDHGPCKCGSTVSGSARSPATKSVRSDEMSEPAVLLAYSCSRAPPQGSQLQASIGSHRTPSSYSCSRDPQ